MLRADHRANCWRTVRYPWLCFPANGTLVFHVRCSYTPAQTDTVNTASISTVIVLSGTPEGVARFVIIRAIRRECRK